MSRRYFGTDGIRGTVGQFPITPEFALRLGFAAGRVLVDHDQYLPTVLIGKDTRISSYMIEAALEAGFAAAGVHVLLTGPLPTPAVAYLTRTLRLAAGVVVSASHNPYQDNGIKFFAANGQKLDEQLEQEIEMLLDKPMATLPSCQLGRARRIDSAADRYIEFCKSSFPNYFSLRGLKIVVDCAHGATYHIAPKVFHELGAEIIGIGTEPSGFNINDKVGATYPATLQTAVLENQADYGLAFDGDGDRLIMVGQDGTIYNGDYLVYIIAKAKLKTGKLKGGVVGTVMTNMAMEISLTNQGIPFARTQVGDRYIFEKLQTTGWLLGGEASGHILCLDKHTTGDGIISALQVFSGLARLNQDLSDITQDWTPFPQSTVNVPINGKNWQTASKACVLQAEKALANQGRIVIRPSGTESVVRIMVEAIDEGLAIHWSNTIAQAILTSK